MLAGLLSFSLIPALVQAIPSPLSPRSVTTLSTSTVNAFTPFTQFARAAYCSPFLTADWTCGQACSANSDFEPFLTGGDGDAVQFCEHFIAMKLHGSCDLPFSLCRLLAFPEHSSCCSSGHRPYAAVCPWHLNMIFYLHSHRESDLTDIDIIMTSLSASLFPNLPGGIEVHQGFADEHAKTASQILSTVKQIISERGATSVTLVYTLYCSFSCA